MLYQIAKYVAILLMEKNVPFIRPYKKEALKE